MTTRAATYTRSAFFEDIIQQLRAELPPELSQFHIRNYSSLIKLFYENERVHFEVWVDSIRSQIEIGLDFEDGAESTAAYLAYFDKRIVEIKARTGPALELERWTKSWGHFVEVYPIEPFERETARMIGDRMVVFMTTLQPMIEEAEIPAGTHITTGGGFWRRRRGR